MLFCTNLYAAKNTYVCGYVYTHMHTLRVPGPEIKKADLVNTQKTETQALGSLREEEHVCCFMFFLHAPRPSPMCFSFVFEV